MTAGAMTPDERWLEGVRVLDLTQYLAGPSCTRLLTELGADVIKVEQPPHGDPSRGAQPRLNRRAGQHIQQNRGKRSLAVDIRRPEGAEIVLDLVAEVDVVVENFAPGVMARRGLDYDSLRARNESLIMASVSGFGQTGPLSDRPCFDLIAQAYSGVMHMTGEADGPPMFMGLGMADTNAGVHAFAAIGHALFHRERTGRGTHLDIAMVDSLFHMHEHNINAVSMTNGEYEPLRQGRNYASLSPAGTFKGPEGWIIILCTHNQMPYLWRALGRPELGGEERFRRNQDRIVNREELTAIIEDWMATFATDAEVIAALESERVPCGPVLSPADAMKHPHFIERGVVREVDDPLAGPVAIPGFPIRSSDPLPDRPLTAPALGEHNHEILSELLGLDGATIAALEADDVLGSKDR